jgi:nitrogen regulatory protein P-II 1
MKLILAVIKPSQLDEVKDALRGLGIGGLTTMEAQGVGLQGGGTEIYRGAEYQVDFVPKVQIELLVEDDRVQDIVEVVIKTARTGKVGDGKIVVLPVDQVYQIGTGETGPEAL